MSNTNTGGPAFPHHVVCDKGWTETQELQGMTLRDYFAAKAMQGLMMRQDAAGFNFALAPNDAMRVSLWAYDLADTMLKARDQ